MGILKQKSKIFNIKRKIGERLKNKDYKNESKLNVNSEYMGGISVITPCYEGEKHISKLLGSLKNQKLSYDLFEHIIVINGDLDNTPQIIENFKEKNQDMNIKVIYSEIANASNARNMAITEAGREYSTFIDIDDYVSPDYLKELYKNAAENRIVVAGFFDVEEGTGKILDSYLTPSILTNQGIVKDAYDKLTGVLTINGCKLIPTYILKQVKFNVNLSSGEDIVFFCKLLTLSDLEFYVIKESKHAVYYRVLRSNSVSRKEISFKFNVLERLDIIKELNDILPITTNITKKFVVRKIRAQSSFINKYLLQYPHKIEKVCEIIKSIDLNYFPYDVLNKGLANKIVISYCFPPYVDTSGNVMAKRINEKAEIVDVVHNIMKKKKDKRLNLIANKFIDKKILINSTPSFRDWQGIKQFCKKGMEKINRIVMEKGEYKEIYSRTMFPASHFLAFEYKIRYPNVKWIAEFSDPMIYDTKGNIRKSNINDVEFMDKLNDLLYGLGYPKCNDDNLFFLSAYLPYLFADEIVFTNENQKEYMIYKFPVPKIRNVIEEKSRVEGHPVPSKESYHLIESDYQIDTDYVNLGYFGIFFETRDLEDVFAALYALNDEYKSKCRIHIFTNDAKHFKELSSCKPVFDNIEINPFVTFFEFLNLTTKFDCLIVNDAHTSNYKEINPYLPSKLSDYLGSGTDIWAICEEGSAMSRYAVDYKSVLDDAISIKDTLKQVIEDHM